MRTLSLRKRIAFSVAVTVGVLFALNWIVESLEGHGFVTTHTDGDVPRTVEEHLWTAGADRRMHLSAYARQTLVDSPFEADKGNRKRAFVLGESWAMGSPYVHQSQEHEGSGGLSFWIRETYRRAGHGDDVEVVNAAAGGQDSARVAAIALEALGQFPDLLFVATCNNEAALPPSRVRERLRKLGGYRLLYRLLSPTPAHQKREWFTIPGADVRAIRDGFEANLRTILQAARERGVPVLLATMPVNLTYDGLERELVMSASEEKLRPCLEKGVTPFEVGRYGDAVSALRQCLGLPEARRWIAMAELRTQGRTDLSSDLEEVWGPCIQDGVERLYAGDPDGAITRLSSCEEVEESLRWIGLAKLAKGDTEGAADALGQSTELLPRNRCRPSFNNLIRDLADQTPGTVLVDLDAAARRASAPGLPQCHSLTPRPSRSSVAFSRSCSSSP